MFKYLSLTATLQEMMIMVRSLPTATIVLNRNCEIVEINQLGLEFLNIQSKDDCKVKRIGVLNNLNSIRLIQKTLITGRVIRNKNHLINCLDGRSIMVNFSACMIQGMDKMFLYQFFELAEFKMNIADQFIQTTRRINNPKEFKDVKELFYKPDNEKRLHRFLSEDVIRFARKNSRLNETEIVICVFIASNMSVNEISKEINSSATNIQGAIYRIQRKFDVKCRRDLNELLKLELPHSSH